MRTVNNADLEFKTRADIEKFQVDSLRDMVDYVTENSPYYRSVLKKSVIKPRDIRDIRDINRLPLTTREQLQKYNNDFFCINRNEASEIVSTTGTVGDPVFITLSKEDLSRLSLNEERSFLCAGASTDDTFHIAVTLDSLFMAGIAYYSGITRFGSCVYRAGMQNTGKHIDLIKDLSPTGIVTVPSFLVRLIRTFKEKNTAPDKTSVKKALLVGESIRNMDFSLNSLGKLIKDNWDIELFSTYGNSECGISFCECGEKQGGHEHPDLIISEILDDTGNPLKDGEVGELVLTTLRTKGMPLIRYQTGDITFKVTEKCKCGRSSSRLGPIIGRKAQMIKFKGVKLYPKVIENALMHIKGIHNYVIEAYTGNDHSDEIIVKIGCDDKDPSIKQTVLSNIQAKARVTPRVEVLPSREVEDIQTDGGSRRKLRFFIDKRSNKQG